MSDVGSGGLEERVEFLEKIVVTLAQWTKFNVELLGPLKSKVKLPPDTLRRSTRKRKLIKRSPSPFLNVQIKTEPEDEGIRELEDLLLAPFDDNDSQFLHAEAVYDEDCFDEFADDSIKTETRPGPKSRKRKPKKKYPRAWHKRRDGIFWAQFEPLVVPLSLPASTQPVVVLKDNLTLDELKGRGVKIRRRYGDDPQRCFHCKIVFPNQSARIAHKRKEHAGAEYWCPKCSKGFKTEQLYKEHCHVHRAKKEAKDMPRECPHCKRVFLGRKSEYIRHVRVHTAEKPFLCDLCGYSATTKTNLSIHLRHKHKIERERPFPCDQCGEKFVNEMGVNVHKFKKHRPPPPMEEFIEQALQLQEEKPPEEQQKVEVERMEGLESLVEFNVLEAARVSIETEDQSNLSEAVGLQQQHEFQQEVSNVLVPDLKVDLLQL